MSRKKLEEENWPKAWVCDKPSDEYGQDLFCVIEDDDTFHIGQSYEEEAAKTLECSICGGVEFNVGQGGYFTAIRCIKCKWEVCIHEG